MFVTYKATTVKHRQELVDVARPLHGSREPESGPIAVRVHFNMRRPLSHFGTGKNANVLKADAREHPIGVPDTDKLLRLVLDGITIAGIIADDAQVVYIKAIKRYAVSDPFTQVEIWRVL
jgi:crossover junction endodeoxyribonuclease RusA